MVEKLLKYFSFRTRDATDWLFESKRLAIGTSVSQNRLNVMKKIIKFDVNCKSGFGVLEVTPGGLPHLKVI